MIDTWVQRFAAWLDDLHDVGPGFFGFMRYPKMRPGPPLAERGYTQEIEEPFRNSVSWVFRLPLSRSAFVFGRWNEALPEDLALAQATAMREMNLDIDEIRSWDSADLETFDFSATNFIEYDDE